MFDKLNFVLLSTEPVLLDCEKRIFHHEDFSRGEYPFVLEVNKKDNIENLINTHFTHKDIFCNKYVYDKDICDKIIPFLEKNKINFRQLGEKEKECLVRGKCYFEDGMSKKKKEIVKKVYDKTMNYLDEVDALKMEYQKKIEAILFNSERKN